MSIDVGKQLGNYRLLKRIGQGGFADVYLGEHVYLKTTAAIKVLRTHLSNEALEQFLTEARTIARLVHPHIISVHDFGMEQETPFLVMSYAPHGTLRERHPEGSVLPAAMVVAYVKQMAQALQYAHDRKVVHRDIKPENMLLADDNRVMLSDFGIAIVSQSMFSTPAHRLIHKTQEAVGTTTYMSPEQCVSRSSAQSDQYALGVVVYEWLCGVAPFIGSEMEIVRQHMYDAVPALREKMPEVDPVVEQVVLRALRKEPEERFGRVSDFAVALEEAVAQKPAFVADIGPVHRSPPLHLPGPIYASITTTDAPHRPRPTKYRPEIYVDRPLARRTILAGLGAVAFAGTMGVIAVNMLRSGNKKAEPVPPKASKTPEPQQTPTEGPQLTPTPTPNTIVLSATRPAIATWGAGQLHLFVRGTDNALWHRQFNGTWQEWAQVAQGMAYDPVVASWSAGRFDVFARGADNTLQHAWYDGSWHAWESLGGQLTSDPAVSTWGAGRLDVFVRSIDNGLWHKAYDGSWHEWESLSGGLTSSPTAVSWAPNRIDVFVRGGDNGLWGRAYDGSWHEWGPLGGQLTSDPAVSSWGPNHLDVFALGAGGALQHIGFEGQWYPWESLGGGLISAPTVVSWGAGRVDVYARDANTSILQRSYENGWQNWMAVP